MLSTKYQKDLWTEKEAGDKQDLLDFRVRRIAYVHVCMFVMANGRLNSFLIHTTVMWHLVIGLRFLSVYITIIYPMIHTPYVSMSLRMIKDSCFPVDYPTSVEYWGGVAKFKPHLNRKGILIVSQNFKKYFSSVYTLSSLPFHLPNYNQKVLHGYGIVLSSLEFFTGFCLKVFHTFLVPPFQFVKNVLYTHPKKYKTRYI